MNERPVVNEAAATCDCPSDRMTRGLSRRGFLGGTLGLTALGLTSTVVRPGSSMQVAYADAAYDGDVLVVVSLRGGYDGLSAVVPVGDPNYAGNRPSIGIPASRVHQLDATFGMHPALAPLVPLWNSGRLGFVQAVGQVDPTRSHFEAMEEMERAAPGSSLRTGWIDRMVGATGSGTPFAGTSLGSSTPPSSYSGPTPVTAMQSVSSFSLEGMDTSDPSDVARWYTALRDLQHGAPVQVSAPAATTLAALHTTQTLSAVKYQPAGGASYPDSDVGNSLRDAAELIKAGVGVRAITLDCGNWDMHVGLGDVDSGWMHDNLGDLGSSLAAFATDLGDAMSGVTLVTLSEFGRRVQENGSGGLDHGHGNCVFLLGGGVRGGTVYGRWPGLADSDLDQGDLAGTTDYRTILAELLEKRCGVSGSSVFPKLPSSRLGIAEQRS